MLSNLSPTKSLKLIGIVFIIITGLNSCKKETSNQQTENPSAQNKIEKVNDSTSNLASLEYKIPSKLGEGAFWNHRTNELLWVDIEGKTLNIYNPKSKENQVIKTPSMIGTVVPKSESEVVVALEDGVYILDLNTKRFNVLSDVEKDLRTNRLNDGKADPSGRLWVGSIAFNQDKGAAKLYMIDAEGNHVIKKDSVSISNGIVWTSDKKTMYYIDTPTSQIVAYDYDDVSGEISNERVAVSIPGSLGYPDGMDIDSEDKLWVGMWNGNAVIRFNPDDGTVMQTIGVPAHNVTSCAFGGENLDILYITSSSLDMTDEEREKYPNAGSLFSIKPGIKGVKNNYFGNR